MARSADTPRPALRVTGLICTFGAVRAVDDIDLEVASGSLLVLLGPSGCGKTTTLRLLAGFERPDAGTIDLDGRRVSGGGVHEPPERRRIGYVAQDLALFPHLDTWHNVAYGLRGVSRPERTARVAELLAMTGLSDVADRMPHELSGGMAQRVALCRALAPRPSVLLLDEPFSSLDQALRSTLRDEVRALLRAAGQTAVMVTHDQEEALSMADRVAVMRDGRIEQLGSPDEVHDRPATPWVGTFVGLGRLVPMVEEDDTAMTPLGRVRIIGERGATSVLLRPEHLRLVPPGEGDADAIVTARRFEGSNVTLRLESAGIDGLWADCPSGQRGLRVGDRVGVQLRADPPPVAFRDT
ncbi:MAG: ABC transporter ATP-binding protein [Chloroflexi bacterium]|nr:ABC transporter ATP-binding protein [Chloroflexota bacterium]